MSDHTASSSYKRLKRNIIKQSTPKRGRGRLQEEVVYERFQL